MEKRCKSRSRKKRFRSRSQRRRRFSSSRRKEADLVTEAGGEAYVVAGPRGEAVVVPEAG